jgi:hypothetical protein
MRSIKAQSNLPVASIILIFLLSASIMLPFGYGLDLGPGPNRIRALIWEYFEAPWFSGVRLVRIGQVLEAVMYTLPTYIFVFQIFNLYRKGLNQKYMAAVGILGALFPGLVSLIQIIGWLQGWTQPPPPLSDHRFPIYIPIPTVLILGMALVRLFPVGSTNEPVKLIG